MGDQYRVLVGINYPPDDKRAEVGDVVDDLPDFAIKKLLAANVVEKYVEPVKTPDVPVTKPAAPESTPAELVDGLKQVQDAAVKGADGIDVLKEAAAATPEEPAQKAEAPEAQPEPAEPAAEPTAPAEPAPVEAPAPIEGASK